MTDLTCPRCTVVVAATFAFCPWCGAALLDASGRFVGGHVPMGEAKRPEREQGRGDPEQGELLP